eukprot:2093097-Rhodomonas_salina.1
MLRPQTGAERAAQEQHKGGSGTWAGERDGVRGGWKMKGEAGREARVVARDIMVGESAEGDPWCEEASGPALPWLLAEE